MPSAAAPIQPLAFELSYVSGVAVKKKNVREEFRAAARLPNTTEK